MLCHPELAELSVHQYSVDMVSYSDPSNTLQSTLSQSYTATVFYFDNILF